MYHCNKINISDLNPHLMCVLCGGYFIDATTIIECLHSFCRTCIVRYLESSKFCPICDVQVHKTRPLLNIRSDKTLQDLVYKLVPGLFEEEMRRRRVFMSQHPEVDTSGMDLEQRGRAHLVPAHSLPEERISLVLQLATPTIPSYSASVSPSGTQLKAKDQRYLLCPSDVSIGHLKKFVRLKFGLPDKYQIDVFYKHNKETINDDFTLLDVTFIYSWNRNSPLRLFYCVYEKPRRKRRLTAAARFLASRPSPAKMARLEADLETRINNNNNDDEDGNDSSMPGLLKKSSPTTTTSTTDANTVTTTTTATKASTPGHHSTSTPPQSTFKSGSPSSKKAARPSDAVSSKKGAGKTKEKVKSDALKEQDDDVDNDSGEDSGGGGRTKEKQKARAFKSEKKNGPGRKGKESQPSTTKQQRSGHGGSADSASVKPPYTQTHSRDPAVKLREKNGIAAANSSTTKLSNGKTPDARKQNSSDSGVASEPRVSKQNDNSKTPRKNNSGVSGVKNNRTNGAAGRSSKMNPSAHRKSHSASSTSVNGEAGALTQLKQPSNCRSSSPKESALTNGRSGSPKLPGGPGFKDARSASSARFSSATSNRSASPKSVVGKGSRSGSPKLLALSSGGSGRAGSPRLASKMPESSTQHDSGRSGSPKLPYGTGGAGGKGSRSNSPKLPNGLSRESLRHSYGYSTISSRELQRLKASSSTSSAAVLPGSLPVDEKISVDVTASSSETSSDVTSPGAEDRSHSTGLEEGGDFDGGGHVCNVAVFNPRAHPLPPSLTPLSNGQNHHHHHQTGCGKGGQTGGKDANSAKALKTSHSQTKAEGKTNSHKRR